MGKGSKRIAAQVPAEQVSGNWKGAFGEYHNPNFPKEENLETKDWKETNDVGIKVQPLSPIMITDGA